MRVLAFDMGTKFGWAVGPDPIRFGSDGLPDVPDPRVFSIFGQRVLGLIRNHRATIVATEMPWINYKKPQPDQVRRWLGLRAIVAMIAHEQGCQYVERTTGEVRKWFCGTASAEWFMVLMECEKHGWKVGEDHDVADALAVMATVCQIPRPFTLEAPVGPGPTWRR